MTLQNKITDYLMDKVHFTYQNVNRVDIECMDDKNFRAGVCLQEFDSHSQDGGLVCLDYYSPKKDFLLKLNIRSLRDLDSVTEHMLMQLYNKGEADLVCFVHFEFTDCMSYRRDRNRTIAKNNHGHLHVVETIIETPIEIINYTRRYYMQQLNLAEG